MLRQKSAANVFIPDAAAVEGVIKFDWVDLPVTHDSTGTSFLNNDGISTR